MSMKKNLSPQTHPSPPFWKRRLGSALALLVLVLVVFQFDKAYPREVQFLCRFKGIEVSEGQLRLLIAQGGETLRQVELRPESRASSLSYKLRLAPGSYRVHAELRSAKARAWRERYFSVPREEPLILELSSSAP